MISRAEAYRTADERAALLNRWYVLLIMIGVYTFSIADRFMVSTLLEPIRIELELTDSGIGYLTGVSLALFYVTLGFPIAWLLDHRNRRNIIVASVVFWSAMTVLGGLSKSYSEFLLARIGVGAGEAGGTPGANSILSDYFPVARRPMALTMFSLGAPIGAWVAASVAGTIADHLGWRAAFLWLGAPGLLFGFLIFATVKEPRRGALDATEPGQSQSLLQSTIYLFSQPSALHIMTANALTALWGWGLMWWTPAYLMRNFDLTVGQAGAVTGPVHLVGGVAATVLTGWLMMQKSMTDPRRIVRFLGGYVGLASVATIFIYSTHSLGLASLLFWVFIPAIYIYIGPVFGLLLNLAPPRMRAQFCAMSLFSANVCNLIIAPQLVGWLSDRFAPNHVADGASLRFAMLFLVPTGFWAAFHYFMASKRLIDDQERATGVRAMRA